MFDFYFYNNYHAFYQLIFIDTYLQNNALCLCWKRQVWIYLGSEEQAHQFRIYLLGLKKFLGNKLYFYPSGPST